MKKELNFDDIQKYYDDDHTWKQCCEKFNVSWRTLYKHKKNGKIIGRSLSESNKLKRKLNPYKTSEETKLKISIGRKKYLKENKHKIKWPGNDSNASIRFKSFLKNNNINFVEEFEPLEDRHFRIDICFPDKKIGIEINGEQHYDRQGNLKEYYKKRHELIENDGWKLYEISHYLVYKKGFLENLITELLNDNLENIDYSFYIKEKINRNCECGNKKSFNAKKCAKCHNKGKYNECRHKKICECGNKKGHKSKKCINCRKVERLSIRKIKEHSLCKCGRKTKSIICRYCSKAKLRKVERPPYKKLIEEIEETNYVQVGKKYGVSDNAIRKWIRNYINQNVDDA